MIKHSIHALACTAILLCFAETAFSQPSRPDTVKAGIYVTSIHDIDFKDNQYEVDFWLWLKYKNKAFDFAQNLEIPQAKSFTKSFSTVDTSDGKVYLLMKLQCVMMDSWHINNFPFDKQQLRLTIENAQYDSHALVFVPDTAGKQYDPRFTLRGWDIDSFVVTAGKRQYETGFGDETLQKPHAEYSDFRARAVITRNANDLFWKMFLGIYVAFLVAYVCFYIHSDNIDSRFGLSVGAFFAAIGNKYVVDSSLPETTSFTLVDLLHGLTLFFIFLIITASAWSLQLTKKGMIKQSIRFDMIAAQVLLFLFVILNVYFIEQAKRG